MEEKPNLSTQAQRLCPHVAKAANNAQRAFLVLETRSTDDLSRLDRFLSTRLRESGFSRESLKRFIKEGKVCVDDVRAVSPRLPLQPGSIVRVLATRPCAGLLPEEGVIDVVYRDPTLAVLNKVAGIVMHPAPGRSAGTLAHRLVGYFPELAAMQGFRPGIVHRLDKDTSGLLLVALTEPCRLALAAAFAGHAVYKEYLALVHGVPKKAQGIVDAPVGRHPSLKTKMAVTSGGKPAKSAWRVLYAAPRKHFSLVAVRIFSGRTHQVRVHMRHLGHALWGDTLYGDAGDLAKKLARNVPSACSNARKVNATACPFPRRQMLHAWKLAFTHPFPALANPTASQAAETKQAGSSSVRLRHEGDVLHFLCPPPEDFTATIRCLTQSMLRVVVTGAPGCGKSSLLKVLARMGVPVFSADTAVTSLYAAGGDGARLLHACFGERFVPSGSHGSVDKATLGLAMRADTVLRREVEALIHPLVWHAIDAFWHTQEEAGEPLAVVEIPLYLEGGGKSRRNGIRELRGHAGFSPSEELSPLLVGVHCPFTLRRKRLREKRGWEDEMIACTESWQWPEEKKMQACDLVFDNTGTERKLEEKGRELTKHLARVRDEDERQVLRHIESLWNKNQQPDAPG